MELNNIIEQYAEAVGGKHSIYDYTKSVVVVPVSNSRYQAVTATIKDSNGASYIALSSKICKADDTEDLLKKIGKLQGQLIFGKVIILNNHLQVVCSISDSMNLDLIKEIINEVAHGADTIEKHLTGDDIF